MGGPGRGGWSSGREARGGAGMACTRVPPCVDVGARVHDFVRAPLVHQERPATVQALGMAGKTPERVIVYACFEEAKADEGSFLIVGPTVEYNSGIREYDKWAAAIQSIDIRDVSDASVVIRGQAPLSVSVLLGAKLYKAATVSYDGRSFVPQALFRAAAAAAAASRQIEATACPGDTRADRGPAVLFFCVDPTHGVSTSDFPAAWGIRNVVNACPFSERPSAGPGDMNTLVSQCAAALREATQRIRDLTGADDAVYVATSAYTPFALCLGMVVRANLLGRTLVFIERGKSYTEIARHVCP